MSQKNVFISIGIVILLIIGRVLFARFSHINHDQTLQMGLIAPLTGDGAPYGEPVRNAVEIAVDEINSSGGVAGKKIAVIYEDGKCNGKDAVTAAQKLVAIDKVRMIIGGDCSSETLAVAPITEAAKVILFSPYSSSPDVTLAGDFVFRNHVSDNYAGEAMAKVIISHYHRVAIVSEETNYASGIKAAFQKSFTELGGEVVLAESFSSDTKDFRSIFAKVKAVEPKAVFLNAQTGAAAGRMATQARSLELAQQFYVAYVAGPDFLSAGNATEGTIVVDDPGFSQKNLKAVAFAKAYHERFGKDPDYPYAAGAAYDAVYLLRDAVSAVGENTEKIRDYLYGLKNFDGVVGSYHFDQNGDVIGLGLGVKKIENGKAVEVQ